jgi:hypothetical protein
MSCDGVMIGSPCAGEKMLLVDIISVAPRLRLERERQVHGHLVAVEVGVEALADERVDLDRVAFDRAPARTPGCPCGGASARG